MSNLKNSNIYRYLFSSDITKVVVIVYIIFFTVIALLNYNPINSTINYVVNINSTLAKTMYIIVGGGMAIGTILMIPGSLGLFIGSLTSLIKEATTTKNKEKLFSSMFGVILSLHLVVYMYQGTIYFVQNFH